MTRVGLTSPDVEATGLDTRPSGAAAQQGEFVAMGAGVSGADFATGAARAMGASGPFATGQSFGRRYHIIRLLGVGGMGAVYQAWDNDLGVTVAIKVIRPEVIAEPAVAEQLENRFKRELLLARQVTHKNVVRIHDLGEIDGIKYITMPYVHGASLDTILRRETRLSLERALRIAKQIVAGLAAAHEVGVIHRDLKPANILIDVEENALITDFGIARSLSAATALTKAAGIVGTLEFMAPEQARGEAVDQRADIYAFGLFFRDVLVGRRQATDENVIAELMERMQHAPAPVRTHVPDLPEAVETIINRCLQPNPADRYQTTRDLAEALDALNDEGRPRPGSEIPARARAARKWRSMAWAAAVAIVVLLLGGAAVMFRDRLPWTRSSVAVVGQPVTVAILPFRNASGDQTLDWLGPSLVEMLRTDIGQSAQLRIVSSNRVQEILRDLRIAPDATLDPAALRRLADFSSAQTVVWGQYLKFGNEIRLDATLEDLRRQSHVALKAEAPTEKGLLGAVAELADAVRSKLALAPDAIKELQASAIKPSSASVQALRHFNEGLQLTRQGKHADALKSFEAAIREDPEFALAYSKLGQEHGTLGYDDDAQRFSRKAVELSESLPPQERYVILANNARALHDSKKAIEAYENLIKASPDDPQAHFDLATLYENAGSLDLARDHFAKVLHGDPKNIEVLLAMGRVETRRRNPQASLEYLNNALSLAVQFDNDEARARILQAIGISYKRLNRPEDALRNYQESLAIKRRLSQKGGMASSFNEIAQVQNRLGRPNEALAAYQEALQLRREIGDRRGMGDTLLDLGVFHTDRGRYDDALKLYKESLQIQREIGNLNYEALCLNNIGNVYLFKAQYEDALSYFERALQLREKANVPADTALTLHNLADTSSRMGQYDQALTYHLRALELWRNAGDNRNGAVESYSMGTVFEVQGRYGASLSSTGEAVKALRDLRDRSHYLAYALSAYGEARTQLGQFDEATKALDEALALGRELQHKTVIAEALNHQGDVLFYRGQFQQARTQYEQAGSAAAATGNRPLMLLTRLNVAKAMLNAGQPQPALRALTGVAEEANTLGLKYLAAEASVDLGEAFVALKDYSRGRQDLERALAATEKMGLRPLLARTHHLLAKMTRAGSNPAEAARHDTEARRLVEEFRKEARSDDLLKRTDIADIVAPPTTGSKAPH